MKKITLDSGLKLEIDESFADDMELLDALIESDEGDALAVSRICTKVLGKDEKKKLYDSLRENGRVPVTKVVPAIKEIFEKIGEQAKNS